MAITNAFRNAVATGNVIGIRIMMKDSLLVDPTFTEFSEMERYTRNMRGLYDDHDGQDPENKSAWDDDYMNKLKVQVVENFSHERLRHLKEVVNYLRPVQVPLRAQSSVSTGNNRGADSRRIDDSNSGDYPFRESSSRPSQPWRPSPQQRMVSRNNQLRIPRIAAGAVAGGVVVGTATVVAGGSFVAGAAAGAVIVGAVVWAATNRR
ncbi:hypothetical protein DFQ01_11521 [Paenibacillus cellulosilyticus]|uniref:Uncharacterized protein n=1 Tax=Paenibacillus cellulosilyticus TaxID=375489 RepID=A0A2V2YRR8_9BACL|nr:hypothetical protein [Paenibacillus cellulosilyticus]PWV99305.1 hypothetical protein DFQ01_11521 [Paenibacillus cellulosilyticus]QKS45070.1 hypothetical protein HUB94_12080 [Paenibacillus cellulosilyticus]